MQATRGGKTYSIGDPGFDEAWMANIRDAADEIAAIGVRTASELTAIGVRTVAALMGSPITPEIQALLADIAGGEVIGALAYQGRLYVTVRGSDGIFSTIALAPVSLTAADIR